MKDYLQIDPYEILEISYDSSEKEIKEAFYKKLKEQNTNNDLIIQAYTLIKNEKARKEFQWNSIFSQFAPYKNLDQKINESDIENLIKEVAFLSDWELGSL